MPARMRRRNLIAMARARRPHEPSSYQKQPEIPPRLRRRLDVIRAVIGERTTISQAAEELSIARVNMQTLVHCVEAAMVSALQPKSTGPTPKPVVEKQLEAQVVQLTKENERLKNQLQAADEMMAAAGEIIRALRGLAPSHSRSSSTHSKRPSKPTATDEDPERATLRSILSRVLERLRTTRDVGARTARALGIDPKTLRRWLTRLCAGQPIVKRRGGTMKAGPPAAETRVRDLVETLHGLSGAASLARSVDGVSRRRAGQIKCEVLTAMERDRKAQCAQVEITRPGVVRGFDAMYLPDGFALTAADGCVPYRTSSRHVPAYNAEHVAEVLDDDFATHGPPLVLRDDRARCHVAEPVVSVLRKHNVLLLQGPPYHAQYYGQHERQNEEHRRWCEWHDGVNHIDQTVLDQMKTALNDHWLRPTLGWRSATQCWQARCTLDDDRDELRHEVEQRAARLRAHNISNDLAMRLAIEQALTAKGYLRVTPGRKTLCE